MIKILENGKEVETLNLGIVEAGKTKKYVFEILNDSANDIVDVLVTIDNTEVSVLEYPRELKANGIGILEIKWNPSVTIRQGLKETLRIEAAELYKP